MKKEETIRKIVNLLSKAQDEAQSVGVPNILHPGLIRDLIVADILEHDLILLKKDADACDRTNPEIKYEYLSCNEGGSCPLEKMFKVPPKTKEQCISAIERNSKIFFAVFYGNYPLQVKVIYELEPSVMVAETKQQLDENENDLSKVVYKELWAFEKGTIFYINKKEAGKKQD